MTYVPPEPDSPRYRRMMNAYYRIKWEQESTKAILFLDRFVEEEKLGHPLCEACSETEATAYHSICPYE